MKNMFYVVMGMLLSTSGCALYGAVGPRGGERQLYTALSEAAKKGNLNEVKRILEQAPALVGMRDSSLGYTPLHFAAQGDKLDVVQYLVEHGADVNAKDSAAFRTPLHIAVQKGQLEVVKYLVEHGATNDWKDNPPPLAIAAEHGHLGIVQFLVERLHVNINAKYCQSHWTALYWAAWEGHLPVVKYLVEHGADVNNQNEPLRHAVLLGNLGIVRYLIEQCHADVNAKNDKGAALLHQAAVQEDLPMIRYLVEHGADVNAKNDFGCTPLHWAVWCGYLQVVQYLVETGKADIYAKDNDGSTPLQKAIENVRLDIVKYLVEHNADANTRDNSGRTLLEIATSCRERFSRQNRSLLCRRLDDIIQYLENCIVATCNICCDDVALKNIVTLQCRHRYCRQCLQGILRQALHDRTVKTLVCPDPSCIDSQSTIHGRTQFTPADVKNIIEGLSPAEQQQLRDKYFDIMTIACLKGMPGIRFCRGVNCSNQWILEGAFDAKQITCPGCHGDYCANCCLPWDHHVKEGRTLTCTIAHQYHEALTSETPEGRADRQARETALQSGGFYCIHCPNIIVRQAGCDHMMCGRDTHAHNELQGCGYDFCIRCLLPWIGHGESWFGGACDNALRYCREHTNAPEGVNPDHWARGVRWAEALSGWINGKPGEHRQASAGRTYWMQLCQEKGRANALP